jgi:hypothetical protein
VGVLTLWIALVGGGLYAMGHYDNTPGSQQRAPEEWPGGTNFQLSARGATALVFLHPRCSCSVATLLEVERVSKESGGRVQITAVFITPGQAGPEGLQGTIAAQAAAIPGIAVVEDRGGAEARRFRALTSGLALLYSPSGRLEFAGGLTGARGIAGSNRGARAFLRAALGTSIAGTSQVFGCELGGPAR